MLSERCKNKSYTVKAAKNQCSNCQNIIKDLVICFRFGAEIGKHKYTHKFEYNTSNLPIFNTNDSWNASDEIKLLDAIEHYGLGNWEAISNAFNNKRSSEDICKHFETFYINGNLGKATLKNFDHLSDNTNHIDISTTDSAKAVDPKQASTIGYSFLRDDYEKEYRNDAENIIKDLHYEPTDTDLEINCKFALYDNYCRILRERQKRKKFVRDYGLINQFFESNLGGKSKDEDATLKLRNQIVDNRQSISENKCDKKSDNLDNKASNNKAATSQVKSVAAPVSGGNGNLKRKYKIISKYKNGHASNGYLRKRDNLKKASLFRPTTQFMRLLRSHKSRAGVKLGAIDNYKKFKPKYVKKIKKGKGKSLNRNFTSLQDGLVDKDENITMNETNNKLKDVSRQNPSPSFLQKDGAIDWNNPICEKLKPFARFMSMSQFKDACSDIINADKYMSEYLKPMREKFVGIAKMLGESNSKISIKSEVFSNPDDDSSCKNTIKEENPAFLGSSSCQSNNIFNDCHLSNNFDYPSSSDSFNNKLENEETHILTAPEREICSKLNLKPSRYFTLKKNIMKFDKEYHEFPPKPLFLVGLEKVKKEKLLRFLKQRSYIHNINIDN
ncbi:unnamed protein product [Gordionus sp. m RMFG-2023]